MTKTLKFTFPQKVHKGGEGSGNFGHSGRPGKVGGSGGSGVKYTIISDNYTLVESDNGKDREHILDIGMNARPGSTIKVKMTSASESWMRNYLRDVGFTNVRIGGRNVRGLYRKGSLEARYRTSDTFQRYPSITFSNSL